MQLARHTPLVPARSQRGFTIVELLIVIVVIGILAAVTIVAFNGVTRSAAEATLKSDLRNVQTYLELAMLDDGSYPTNLNGHSFSSGTNPEYTESGDAYCATVSSDAAETSFFLDSTTGLIEEGACSGHSGSGEVAFDQPDDCPAGFIPVPGSSTYGTEGGFCVMKYEAKNVGGIATSQASGAPWVSISQTNAISTADAACDGCHLVTEAEWLTIAQNVLGVDSNWSGGSVGSGSMYRGHTDSGPANSLAASTDNDGYSGTGQTTGEQGRTLTLTNGEVIWDLAGNVWEWISGTTEGGNQPGEPGYAWRDWNSLSVPGNLSPNPYPSYANSDAAGWNSSQSIGRIYSDSAQTGLRAFRRGGHWTDGSYGGVFALSMGDSPSNSNGGIGFRVAR